MIANITNRSLHSSVYTFCYTDPTYIKITPKTLADKLKERRFLENINKKYNNPPKENGLGMRRISSLNFNEITL